MIFKLIHEWMRDSVKRLLGLTWYVDGSRKHPLIYICMKFHILMRKKENYFSHLVFFSFFFVIQMADRSQTSTGLSFYV